MARYLDRLEEMAIKFFRHFHGRMGDRCAVSPSQYFVLRILHQNENTTVSDVAAQLGMTVAGATGLLDRMERAGLVRRERDEADRRLVRVSLTEEGARQFAEIRALRRSIIAELASRLAPGELEQLVFLYAKMIEPIPSGDSKSRAKG